MATTAKTTISESEQEILSHGLDRLRELLPSEWTLALQPSEAPGQGDRLDAIVQLSAPGFGGRLILEVKRRFAPRDVEAVAGGRLQLLRDLNPWDTFMVVAPWLSPRTQALLVERNIGYIDLTGNASLRISRPAVMIRTVGAVEDPSPPRRGGVSLRGVVAGRVVRLLADVGPPYTATAIAGATGVSIAQVSRLLMTLDREALIQRDHRGLVVDVDWAELLRRRAESYHLFKTNQARTYISGRGTEAVLFDLAMTPNRPLFDALTGSFPASWRAPIAAPSQLAVYVKDADRTAQALGLLPTDRGANVVLLRPYDSVVLDRAEWVDDFLVGPGHFHVAEGRPGELEERMTVVAASQLALDCLAGNGRMPAEGEALLGWMAEHEAEWRRPGIEHVPPR